MDKIILASNNQNKIKEISKLLEPFNVEVKSLKELGLGDPVEDGKNFQENSLIKARYAFEKTGLPSLADDSGYCIESLNDFPGLSSSRFSKACGGYPEAFRVLSECINPINKKAHYTTCISFIYKDNSGKVIENCFEGKIEGEFVYPARGENGFGYDPTFLPNGYDKTFGELPNELRITINHRALALQKFFEFFKKYSFNVKMQKIKHYIFIVLVILITMFSVIIFKNQKYTENKLNNNIQNIIKNKDLTLGLAVKKDDKILFEINGNQEFPLLSVFKFHITLSVLNYIDKNNIPLDQTIKISKDFIKTNTYSPLREKYGVVDLELTLQELIEYTMIYSDNNTCDILIDFVGGVDKVNNYIKSLGIKNCNITLNEDEMHKDFKNQYLNTSTPIEIVNLLDIFYHKDLFSNKYKEFLINTMIATKTGNKKIRYLLPKNVKVGDKTGSSDRLENNIKIADNDSGFIILPNGEVYFLSIFIYNSKESDEKNTKIIAEISKAIYNFIARN